MVRWCAVMGLLTCCEPSVRDTPESADVAAPAAEADEETEAGLPVGTELLADDALREAVALALAAAETRVRVAQYTLWDSGAVVDLVDALGDAAERGVRVQVLADEEASDTPGLLAELEARGVETQLDSPDVTLHNKLWIIDDAVLTGSHNMSNSALTANREVSVRVTDPEAVAAFSDWFDAVWAAPESDPTIAAMSGATRAYFDDAVLDGVLGCIAQSRESLRVAMYAFSWSDEYPGGEVDQVLQALLAAHARGVALQVVLDGSSWIVDNAINEGAIAQLTTAGVPVRVADNEAVVHAKVMVCDQTAFVSDANWSYSGMVRYHGASVAVDGARVADPLAAWIDGLWRDGKVPD